MCSSDLFANPQIVHREMLRHTDTGAVRDSAVPVLRNPIRLSQTPIHGYRRPPRLGADTDDVLADVLGATTSDIDKLRAAGAI